MSEDRLLEEAQAAVETAQAKGADDAVAAVSTRRGLHFKWRDGSLEDVKEDAARGLAVSIYVDGRYSTHTTNDLDPGRLEAFLGEAVALTRHLQPDPYREIPDPALYTGRSEEDLDLVDPAVTGLSRDDRIRDCRAMEEAARADESVISSTTHVQDAHAVSARASSNGFLGTQVATSAAFVATVTARDGETKRPEDHWFVAGTHLEGLPDREAVGREALERVLARRGARKVTSRRTTMVVHPEAGANLLGRMFPALAAGAVQQRRSFLAEMQGKRVASDKLTLRDDPLVVRGLGSRLYDGEGLAARPLSIVEGGILETFFVDTYYGKKLGWAPTTGSPSNLVFEPGEKDLAGIVADVPDGLLVTSLIGGNANLTSGDYSYGLRGHLIENGEITQPVSEMNVTGNYLDLLQRLVLVGSDPVPYFTCKTPTLVFEGVQFSGR